MCINAHKASTIDQFESILCSRFAFQLFFCLDFNTKNCYQHKVDVLLQLLLLECELYCLMSSSKIVIPLFKIKKYTDQSRVKRQINGLPPKQIHNLMKYKIHKDKIQIFELVNIRH